MNDSDWIKAGTATDAPVTSVTPEAAAAPEAPTAEAPAAPAPAEAPAPPAPPAAEQVQEFLEAQLNGEPYQLPKGVHLPLKRGEDVEWRPVEDVLKGGMLERDYRIKRERDAAERREWELRLKAQEARLKEQERIQQEIVERAVRANTSPEELLKFQTWAELSKSDPFFKKIMDDAVAGRMIQAERQVYTEEAETAATVQTAHELKQAIDRISSEMGVDPERVRVRYAEELQANRAELSEAAIRQIAQSEAQYATSLQERVVSPLQKQIEELNAKIAAFEAAQSAIQAHNASTTQAMSRSKQPVGAPLPAAGAPAPMPPASHITGRTMRERRDSWAAQR